MLIKLEINKENIKKNIKKIKDINKNIIYVLKDDAYGLGIENIFPILIEENCNDFAVSYIEEALFIKKIIKEKFYKKQKNINVICLNYIEIERLEEAINNEIEITLFNLKQFDKYIKEIEKIKCIQKIKFHLKFNTGMNRLGFNIEEIESLYKKISKLEEKKISFEIKSVYSHIGNSENVEETEKQVKLYEKILNELNKKNIQYKFRHLQASPLIFKYGKKYNYDFARIGMVVYGMEPLSENVGLHQVVKLTSKIINIRNIKKGEQVSYGNRGIVKRDSKIAVIPIGYAHGLQKQIENKKAYVIVNGLKAYILGEICMDMIIVDVTDIQNVNIDDEVTILGKNLTEEITLKKMARWANTIQDDILTKLNKNIKKVVI